MKYKILIITLLSFYLSYCQEEYPAYDVDINFNYGNTIPHSKKVSHIKTDINGFTLSFNKNTFGNTKWERLYNRPSYGIAFAYQDLKLDFLGEVYTIYVQYTHYIYKRKLSFMLADGISYSTNSYDKYKNKKNIALSSKFLNGIFLKLQYKEINIYKRLGFQTALLLSHYSNGMVKLPNMGLNSYLFQMGINYCFDNKKIVKYDKELLRIPKEKREITYNLSLSSGINQAIKDSKYHYFWEISTYIDKKINNIYSINLGVDYFNSYFLKEWIDYQIKYTNADYSSDTSYKRLGIFIGNDLIFGDISLFANAGYYLYNPSKYGKDIYQRLGLKYRFSKNIFTSLSVKAHFPASEAIELGIGIRK